jgi:SRSO17 transposase
MQHFMSNSPWSAQVVIQHVQAEIAATPELRGGVLILDESANDKKGGKSAGVARQYNGRRGKVGMCQVGTLLAYTNGSEWTWVDGELYLPEQWFTPEMAELRKRLGIPTERKFKTKIELGWKMIQRVHANGFPFEAICCDDFYGRSEEFRARMNAEGHVYMADVPRDTLVYLKRPIVGVPGTQPGRRGPKPSRSRVLSEEKPLKVCDVASREDTDWHRVRVRSTERGELNDEFATRRVWAIQKGKPVQEWLVIRHESDGKCSYSLSNASPNTHLKRLAWLKSQRYFVERTIQDAKSELGWDELEAQKYLAWMHHLALTILALWFVTQTKLDWKKQFARDPTLLQQLEVEVLPALSMANVRALLRAAMPLPQLTPEKANALVIEHLVNRTRSRKSRIKAKHK